MTTSTRLRDKRARKEAFRKAVHAERIEERMILRNYRGTKQATTVGLSKLMRRFQDDRRHHRPMAGEHTRKAKKRAELEQAVTHEVAKQAKARMGVQKSERPE